MEYKQAFTGKLSEGASSSSQHITDNMFKSPSVGDLSDDGTNLSSPTNLKQKTTKSAISNPKSNNEVVYQFDGDQGNSAL